MIFKTAEETEYIILIGLAVYMKTACDIHKAIRPEHIDKELWPLPD